LNKNRRRARIGNAPTATMSSMASFLNVGPAKTKNLMKQIINSPIVITIIVIIAAFVLKSQSDFKLGSEMRGAYDALIDIAEDASSDEDKTKAIQDFAEQIASQLKEGFSAGFASGDDDKESREAKFLRTLENVQVTEIREIPSEWKGRQTVLFKIENNSEYPLSQIKVNLEYYRDGELIDVKNESLHEIKVLDAGKSFTAKEDRNMPNHLTEEEKATHPYDEVRVSVTSFKTGLRL
jgi:hypothetical protein